ncbi:MAG: T9SS type A sorting domain-containing protein [Bacteroidales bacterium]|nr:T9SS type A sorting domain-containing protein [Bacteroidales bacterium]
MKLSFVLILFILISLRGVCQFPPAAGMIGSTAIYADSNIFVSWANNCYIQRGYQNIAQPELGLVSYGNDYDAIGKANNQVVSLGDAGIAILTFSPSICDKEGFDFAVFENSFNDTFLELAFVEISSDSLHWFRFPAISLTPANNQIGTFGSVDATQIHNLAGKYRVLYGTPFDISDIEDNIYLNKQNIKYVKIIDVIGTIDSTYASFDSQGHIINDPYPTAFNTGGFDLDAVGVIHPNENAIDNNSLALAFIAPNPCDDVINIIQAPQNLEVIIYDEYGIEVLKKSNATQIQLSTLSSGVYFLRIENQEINQLFKIIKR